jgi:transposase
LALLASKGLLHPVRVPTEPEEADGQVLRLREQLVCKARTVQVQIKAFLLQHGVAEPAGLGHWSNAAVEALRRLELLPELRFCLDLLLDELAHARQQVRKATERLNEVADSERHRPTVAALRTVPGMGLITATVFRLELPEPQRFEHGGQVARMAGLAPQVRQSGDIRREGGLLKSGTPGCGRRWWKRPGGGSPATSRRRGLTAGWWRTPAAARRRSRGWRGGWGCCSGG